MTRKRLPLLMLCQLCLVQLLSLSTAFADYYKYTDSRGVVSITNKLESVPAKYRSTMKVLREEPRKESSAQGAIPPSHSEAAPATQEAAAVATAQAPEGRFSLLSARFVWFKPLVYLAASLALFMVVVKLTSLLPSPLLSKAIYLAFFIGVSVFLYKSYVESMVESTSRMKEKAVNMMKKANVREQPESASERQVPPQ